MRTNKRYDDDNNNNDNENIRGELKSRAFDCDNKDECI